MSTTTNYKTFTITATGSLEKHLFELKETAP